MHGIHTALVTPFGEDGRVDLDAYERLAARQLDNGVTGLVPCGTTGETPTLTTDEWKYVYSTEARDQLFNLRNDPHEKHDLWTEDHEIGKRLERLLLEQIGIQAGRGVKLRAGQENEKIPMDDKMLEELKQLGYF